MANPDNTESNHVGQLFDQTLEFNDGTSIHATAWEVPSSDAYPGGVHYRLHFGSPNGTIIRYDNAHDGRHERHDSSAVVEAVDFPGVIELYERFLREVDEWRNER